MSASAPAAAAATLSSTVRAILHANANRPLRVNALWDAVRAAAPALAKSKTHFKDRIIGNMFLRDEVRVRGARGRAGLLESTRLRPHSPSHTPSAKTAQLVKLRVPEADAVQEAGAGAAAPAAAAARLVYAVRLKGSGNVRRLIKAHGLDPARAALGSPRSVAADDLR